MEYLKLIGILIIVVGFALKWDVIAVVLISGLVTGLVSGLDFVQILEIMGKAFVDNRLMSIFLISFPAIALIERYGMKERAAELIGKIKNATAGKVLSIYMVVRILASAMSIRLGGHVQFVRPLILPMSEAAGETSIKKPLIEKQSAKHNFTLSPRSILPIIPPYIYIFITFAPKKLKMYENEYAYSSNTPFRILCRYVNSCFCPEKGQA